MLFTIIISVFNKEQTISRCLESVLDNFKNNFEIIIIDDGSSDHSLEIINSYKSNFPNLFIYHQSNMGIGYVRKKAISIANGEYIIFLDADDALSSNLLHTLKPYVLEIKPDIIRYNIDEINSVKEKNRYISPKYGLMTGKEALELWSEINIRYGLFSMYAIRRDLFFKTEFIVLNYYEDVCNIPRLLYFAKNVLVLNYTGYSYYRSANSLTMNSINNKSKLEHFVKAHDSIIYFFKEQLGENDSLYKKIKEYYDYHLKRKGKELLS